VGAVVGAVFAVVDTTALWLADRVAGIAAPRA
jgi:hypothetical protein